MNRAAFVSVLSLLLFSPLSGAQSASPANDQKILVQDLTITGVQTIGTAELNDIKGRLTAKQVNDEDEIRERLRAAFQDRGFFSAKVNSIRVRVADPLARPRPASVEADVSEGPLFKIGQIKFLNNHAVSAEELSKEFPVKKGDAFSRTKIATGLEATHKVYLKNGYIDMTVVPDTVVAPPTVDIVMDISEGNQYRFGTLMFTGNPNLGEQLRPRWELEPGQPFDASYLEKFIDENRSLLPSNFDGSQAVTMARDCDKHLVTLLIDLDPGHPAQNRPKNSGCDKKQ